MIADIKLHHCNWAVKVNNFSLLSITSLTVIYCILTFCNWLFGLTTETIIIFKVSDIITFLNKIFRTFHSLSNILNCHIWQFIAFWHILLFFQLWLQQIHYAVHHKSRRSIEQEGVKHGSRRIIRRKWQRGKFNK